MSSSLYAQHESRPAEPGNDLLNLDLKALMNIEITSVSRRAEPLAHAAGSVFVITADDIRRSGATNLPEALRLAPALHVVQVNANGYTVSARGFINAAANKLLVLIDGRAVYSPLFSGVFWDVQDVLLEDVERIEVVSGPGGTLWGVNAVNGIINIITRSARDTQGVLLAAGGGNRETISALRYGGHAGPNGHYRVYGKYLDYSHTQTADGTEKDDAAHKTLAGIRGDWKTGADELMVVAAGYTGTQGQPPPGTITTGARFTLGLISTSGLNVTTRWNRRLGKDSNLTVQGYFDRTTRDVPPTFAETLNIVDLHLLHSWRPAKTHTAAWGAEYRYGMDRVTNSAYVAFLPARVNQTWVAAFAQDEITLRPNVRLTVGGRVERNDYTGYEVLPNARLAWNAATNHLLWAAASRAVRAPSRLDRDTFVPGQPPFVLTGGPDVVSEIADVFEVGYRGQPTDSITFSASAFRAFYDDLRTQEIAPSRTTVFFANGMEATTTGVEMWGAYQASDRWRLTAGFNGFKGEYELKPGSNDVASLNAQRGRDPSQSWRLRSSLDLPWHSEFDVTARYVSKLSNPAVPGYSAVDLRYGWRLRPGLELSVAGLNVFGNGHGEFDRISTRTEIGRGVFVKLVSRLGAP